jgi:hypothetical protein
MAEFIKYLKDPNGNIFYPITHVDAVKFSENNSYQTIVDNNLQTEDKTIVGAINELLIMLNPPEESI